MEDVQEVQFEELGHSKYLRPLRMRYKQAGKEKAWDLMRSHRSVAILIFRTDIRKFVFVRQFRPAVYTARAEETEPEVTVGSRLDQPGSLGLTLELCAGIVDKADRSLAEIAREEVLEECGYSVPADRLHPMVTFPNGIGTSGATSSLYYLEVTAKDRVGAGGGLAEEGELISVVEMEVEEARRYIAQPRVNSPAGFLFAVQWYLANRLAA